MSLPEDLDDPQNTAEKSLTEPAGIGARFGALCLDMILIILVFVVLLTQVVFPFYYPGAMDELQEWLEYVEESGDETEPPPMGENLQEAFKSSNVLSFFFIFLYFAFVPVFMGGGTLGMRIFNLRIQNRDKLAPASIGSLMIRSAVKTFSIQVLFLPYLTLIALANFLVALTNPRRATIHDMFARTVVVRGPAFSRS
ncbi:MAG: RDD family protein [Verrucomicrobiota bacterium]